MRKQHWIFVIALNLCIALAFFIKNQGEGYDVLSSDQDNIIPMCMKMDNPDLYPYDLFAADVENFKYYTPFFVQPLRGLAKLTGYDYIAALNIKLFITHMLFGIAWFYLFYLVVGKRFLLALLMSIVIRGIVWLPGSEIWGISDIWTLLPRTVYAAMMPLPFILLFQFSRLRLYTAGLTIGFLFNFHPISGLGGILIFVSLLLGLALFAQRRYHFRDYLVAFGLMMIAATPFLFTYFSKTPSDVTYDLAAYQLAFSSRIPSAFQDSLLFLQQWVVPKTLFFAIPLIGYILYGFFGDKTLKSIAKLLLLVSAAMFVLPLLSIPVEQWLNETFDKNLRMSFQIVRVQKLVVLPAYIAMALILKELWDKLDLFRKLLPYGFGLYALMIVVAHVSIFDGVPIISEDIIRGVFPNTSQVFASKESKISDFDKIANYINTHTPMDVVFYKNFKLRAAAQRSVRLDSKGASILIESSPTQLIRWYHEKQQLKALSPSEVIDHIKKKGVTHWLVYNTTLPAAELITEQGDYRLYKL